MKKLVLSFVFLFSVSFQVNAQWQQLNSPVLLVNDVLKLSDATILIGTPNGLFISIDNFLTWDSTSITNNVNLIQKDDLGNIYASVLTSSWIQPGYLFRSTDLGLTWNIPYDSIPGIPFNVRNIFINDSGYIFTTQGHGDYLGHYTTALKSTDFGTTWIEIYNFFCACNLKGLSSSIIETVSGTLFLSELLYDYNQYLYHYYIKKKELGSNWAYIFANKFANNMYLYNDELYMATTSVYTSSLGLIKSSDDGNTFVQLNNGFFDLDVKQLILKPEVFIALNDDGIYRSLDEGNNWIRLDHTGLNSNINRIYMDDNHTIYACTDNGIYVFTGILNIKDEKALTYFSLKQNYPNPFNPNTNIQYAISNRQFITLKVYDVLGKEVAILVNEEKPVGSYEVEFQSSVSSLQLASGIYYYQLRAGDFVETKKMILMK